MNYEKMAKSYSESELISFCNHKNPVVRCYAFRALIDSCKTVAFNVLLSHLADTAIFKRVFGDGFGVNDILDDDRVTDYYLDMVGYRRLPNLYTLSEEQYNYIDSILLFGNEINIRSGLGSIRRSRSIMLEHIKPKPGYYNRIRDIVKGGVYEALPLLAQYRNPADTIIFKKLLVNDEFSQEGRILKHYVRYSITYFPHQSFYPILKNELLSEICTNEISDDYESFPLYEALAQYPTLETKELFENALKKCESEYNKRLKFISFAIKKYPSNILNQLIKEMPLNQN